MDEYWTPDELEAGWDEQEDYEDRMVTCPECYGYGCRRCDGYGIVGWIDSRGEISHA